MRCLILLSSVGLLLVLGVPLGSAGVLGYFLYRALMGLSSEFVPAGCDRYMTFTVSTQYEFMFH